jgi:hypothetical protein
VALGIHFGALSPEVRRTGREAYNSSASSASSNMLGPIPRISYMTVWRAKGKIYLLLYYYHHHHHHHYYHRRRRPRHA